MASPARALIVLTLFLTQVGCSDDRHLVPAIPADDDVSLIATRSCYESGDPVIVGFAGAIENIGLDSISFYLDHRTDDDRWERRYLLSSETSDGKATWKRYEREPRSGENQAGPEYGMERPFTLVLPDEAHPGRYRIVPTGRSYAVEVTLAERCGRVTTKTLPSYTTTSATPRP